MYGLMVLNPEVDLGEPDPYNYGIPRYAAMGKSFAQKRNAEKYVRDLKRQGYAAGFKKYKAGKGRGFYITWQLSPDRIRALEASRQGERRSMNPEGKVSDRYELIAVASDGLTFSWGRFSLLSDAKHAARSMVERGQAAGARVIDRKTAFSDPAYPYPKAVYQYPETPREENPCGGRRMNPEGLYSALQRAGIFVDHHETDLYFPMTERARKILARFPQHQRAARTFTDRLTGKLWVDVPFAYEPAWERGRRRNPGLAYHRKRLGHLQRGVSRYRDKTGLHHNYLEGRRDEAALSELVARREARAKNPGTRGESPDMVYVRELDQYAENTRELYNQFKSIIANLMLKLAKGQYDPARAPRLWQYWYDEAARRYKREYGAAVPVSVRREAASQRAAEEYQKIIGGEYGPLPTMKTKKTLTLEDYRENPAGGLTRAVGGLANPYERYRLTVGGVAGVSTLWYNLKKNALKDMKRYLEMNPRAHAEILDTATKKYWIYKVGPISGKPTLMRKGTGTGPMEKPRVSNPKKKSASSGYRMFHGKNPDKAYRTKVPKGFPRKLWFLGTLKRLELSDGTVLRGGAVAAGSGNRIYLLGAKGKPKSKSARVKQIEYKPPPNSQKAGAVYYHPFKRPPAIKAYGRGYYAIAGRGVRLTPRGIIG